MCNFLNLVSTRSFYKLKKFSILQISPHNLINHGSTSQTNKKDFIQTKSAVYVNKKENVADHPQEDGD